MSPVWRAKLCWSIGADARWHLALDGEEAQLFAKLIALGSGESVMIHSGLEGVVSLGQMADTYHRGY